MSHPFTQPGSKQNHLTPAGFKVWRPGQVAYRDALAFQEQLVEQRPDGSFDLLILLEHPHVITLGRSADEENLRCPPAELLNAGIECISTRRGGDITLHNPGQLVGYPIVDLNHYQRDLHLFLRLLEKTLIATLADFGIIGETLTGKTGVWTGGRKIASIGVAVRRWISYHGFALNVCNDLAAFDNIVPCGLADVTMTSMAKELGKQIDIAQVTETLTGHFASTMQRPFLGSYYDHQTSS